MNRYKPATLHLENGKELYGFSFGNDQAVSGEVVFSTAMVGYPESLTDPANFDKIVVFTVPMVGNYGVSPEYQSEKIYAKAVVVSDYSAHYSHWSADKSLGEWLKEQKIPALFGVDTRELSRVIRDNGPLRGAITPEGFAKPLFGEEKVKNLVKEVSCSEVIHYGSGDKRVVVVDCGVKQSTIKELLKRAVEVVRVPWNYNFNEIECDGILISSGPGDPNEVVETVENLRVALNRERAKALFGIGLGGELIAIATGAKCYKLNFGHRGDNQPVRLVGSDSCYITSQNHGYAIDSNSLNKEWTPLFMNMNDNSLEGIKHLSKPFFTAEFIPLSSGGPTETSFLFDNFVDLL